MKIVFTKMNIDVLEQMIMTYSFINYFYKTILMIFFFMNLKIFFFWYLWSHCDIWSLHWWTSRHVTYKWDVIIPPSTVPPAIFVFAVVSSPTSTSIPPTSSMSSIIIIPSSAFTTVNNSLHNMINGYQVFLYHQQNCYPVIRENRIYNLWQNP